PIGLLIVQLARIAGARQVAVSDVSDDRLARALALGATHTVNAQTGRLADAVGEVDIAFEAVGVQAALDDAYATLRKGGRLVLVTVDVKVLVRPFEKARAEVKHSMEGKRHEIS